MATYSTRLLLKRPDGSDPFLRQDFVDNWNKLDEAPGIHICTSTSRPSWGTAQAGRQIYETDTRMIVTWTGTLWLEPLYRPSAWTGAIAPNASLVRLQTYTYTIATAQSTRLGTFLVTAATQISCAANRLQNVNVDVLVGGTVCTIGGPGFTRFAGNGDDPSNSETDTVVVFGWRGTLNPGSYTIQLRYTVGSDPGANVALRDAKVMVLLVNHNNT